MTWGVINANTATGGASHDGGRQLASVLDTISFTGLAAMKTLRTSQNVIVVHLIEPDVGLRANIARRLLGLGFHAEIYTDTREFAEFAPAEGIILVDDANHPGGLVGVINACDSVGTGLPIIAFCASPTISGVVAAMKARAVNYLPLDVADAVLAEAITDAHREGEQKRSYRHKVAACGKMIDHLSPRERQVLELLVEGESNKGMARTLGLSPRTIEIHRMKMMGKLAAKTPAQAVKIWCAASLQD